MKKLSLALVAFLVSASAVFAQQTDINFALTENGAEATASSGDAQLAIDGNDGTRWESAQTDEQWWQVDLGQARTFNTVQIRWEGAFGASFTVDYSSDQENWENFATVTDQKLEPFPYEQTLDVEQAVTARYVRFSGTKRGTAWGYSFWEFRVLNASASVLTTLEAKPANDLCKLGEAMNIQIAAKDQNGKTMTAENVQYTIEPADAGAIVNHVYTPAKRGLATITARVGEVAAAPFTVFTYEGENLALSPSINESKVIAQSDFAPSGTDAFHAVDGNLASVWQGSATNGTSNEEADRTYDAWFVVDLGGFYDINLVTILFEGACSETYHLDFSVDNKTWNLAYNYVGNAGVNGHTDMLYGENLQNSTGVRFVRFYSTKAATQYGMKIFEMQVFGTEGAAPEDNEKPVMVSAELVSTNYNSAIIAVEATDNMGIALFHVQDNANAFDARFAAAEGQITVTGLKTNTTYNLAITAVDLAGNESEETKTVQVSTPMYNPEPTTAAPTPIHDASKVLSIYSDSYEPVTTALFNQPWWTQPTLEEKEIDGNKYLRYSAPMNGINGWEYTSHIDASKMTYLHVDIWPSVTGTITISPIFLLSDGATQQEVAIVLDVEQEKWNSFDIKLADYPTINYADIFQTKWSDYATQTEFSVDNFYFWTNGTTTLLDAVENSPVITKMIQDGQIIIIRDGVRYDVMGNVLR